MAQRIRSVFDLGEGRLVADPRDAEARALEASQRADRALAQQGFAQMAQQALARKQLGNQEAQFAAQLGLEAQKLQQQAALAKEQLTAQQREAQASREFRADEAYRNRAFQGGESAAARALQELLQGRSQEFAAGQSYLDRAFRGREGQATRALQELLQGRSQEFAAGQSELDRAFRGREGRAERSLRELLQDRQMEFSAGQSQLDRDAARRAADQQLASEALTSIIEALGIEDPAAIMSLQNQFLKGSAPGALDILDDSGLGDLAGPLTPTSPGERWLRRIPVVGTALNYFFPDSTERDLRSRREKITGRDERGLFESLLFGTDR